MIGSGLATWFVLVLALAITQEIATRDLVFEATSALGTVGLWGLLIIPAQLPGWLVTGTLVAAGRTEDALQTLQALRQDAAASAGLQRRAAQLIVALGGDVAPGDGG